MKVLYIDDDAAIRTFLRRYITHWGYDVLDASDGETGWQLILEHRPDIVITDWNMPDLNGPDLCCRIRDTELPGYIYLIMLTARTGDVVKGMEAGADDFMGKPFNKEELKVRIKAGERIIRLQQKLETANRILEENKCRLEASEEQLRKMAHYDKLTGLPNRVLFFDRLERAVIESHRNQQNFGLLFVDLDAFKAANDTYGHDTGDGLLCKVAERMQESVRASDTVARMGGDEFCVIVREITTLADCVVVAEKIIASLSSPFDISGNVCEIGASVGIALFPDDGVSVAELVNHADSAMYAAKKSEKGSWRRWQL